MLKRLSLALAGLFAFVQVALGAGTIPGISMTQQLDSSAKPLSGGLLYLIQAGTTSTPQSCYQDSALTLAWPNPITLDAAGRVPQLFCADGNIKIRLTDKNGVNQLVQDNLLVIGASSGGGGGGSVDATTVLATGDVKARYSTGTLSGFVRANGRTIGSATSGATERANADTQALFEYLWGADANLTVSGGRGASANADWTANKTIALPDFRGRVIAGDDAMGASAANRLTAASMSTTGLGGTGGVQTVTLTTSEMPSHYHAAGISDPVHQHTYIGGVLNTTSGTFFLNLANSGANAIYKYDTAAVSGNTTGVSVTSPNGAGTTYSTGGGAAHQNVQPTILMTYYVKL